MACEATARLYDVDEDSVVFKKLQLTQRYDHGTITFRARKGMLIDLNKLHESIRATRLSGGTSSGLVSLEVDAKGRLVESDDQLLLEVDDSDAHFVLRKHPDEKYSAEFNKLRTSALGRAVKISGRIDNYKGRWPQVLRNPPENPRRILVSGFEILD